MFQQLAKHPWHQSWPGVRSRQIEAAAPQSSVSWKYRDAKLVSFWHWPIRFIHKKDSVHLFLIATNFDTFHKCVNAIFTSMNLPESLSTPPIGGPSAAARATQPIHLDGLQVGLAGNGSDITIKYMVGLFIWNVEYDMVVF